MSRGYSVGAHRRWRLPSPLSLLGRTPPGEPVAPARAHQRVEPRGLARPARIIVALCLGVALTGCTQLAKRVTGDRTVETEGDTSPIAARHRGEVIFSRTFIPRAPTNTDDVTDTFTLDDPIYLRAFFKDSQYNECARAGHIGKLDWQQKVGPTAWLVQIEDAPDPKTWIELGRVEFNADMARTGTNWARKRSLTEAVVQEGRYHETWPYLFMADVLPDLKVGDNRLTVHVQAICRAGEPFFMARGGFTLRLAEGDAERHVASKGPQKMDEPIHPDNDRLAPELMALMRAWKDTDDEPLSLAIRSSRWVVQRHQVHGTPLRKTMSGEAVMRRASDGKCFRADVEFTRPYAGQGDDYLPPRARYARNPGADLWLWPCASPLP